MPTEAESAWVARVLGIEAGTDSSAGKDPQPSDLLALFRDAKDEVDAALERLRGALRDTEDEDLIRIADLGLFGMTDGEGVGLMKALFEWRAASPEQRAARAKAAAAAAKAYKDKVFAHKLAGLVEANPFGVPVGLKSRLGPALDAIARAI